MQGKMSGKNSSAKKMAKKKNHAEGKDIFQSLFNI